MSCAKQLALNDGGVMRGSLRVAAGAMVLLSAQTGAAQIVQPTDSVQEAKPHFRRAFAEMFSFELAPYSYNRWVGKKEEDQTTLQSWWYNLRRGWSFDNNDFPVNHWEHPYSGSIYFNSARSHGYDFWHAALFPMAGSALWEYFGEKQQASINDQVNTTLGGIILGETLYRFSSAMLDDRTTGFERFIRELGAGLINPPRGFARLFGGDVGHVGPNTADHVLNALRGNAELGMFRQDRQLSRRHYHYGQDQFFGSFSLTVGDPLAGVKRPFDAFRLELATATGGSASNTEARALGFLATDEIVRRPSVTSQLALAMHYHYNQNAAFVTGGEGFSGGLLSRYTFGGGMSIRSEAWLTGIVLGAVKPDSGTPRAARDTSARGYDYGSGAGARLLVRLDRGRQTLVDISYQPFWYAILSGVARAHFYDIASARVQLPLIGSSALGIRQTVYHRVSRYAAQPVTRTVDGQTQLFAAISF